jgi:hypothetical protein
MKTWSFSDNHQQHHHQQHQDRSLLRSCRCGHLRICGSWIADATSGRLRKIVSMRDEEMDETNVTQARDGGMTQMIGCLPAAARLG